MSLNDIVADCLTRIRNAQSARLKTVDVLYSGVNVALLEVLKSEGYISDFAVRVVRKGVMLLHVKLKYYSNRPVINSIKRVSKPGRRVYWGASDIKKFYNGLGIFVISTPSGVMCDRDARAAKVGGEVICSVF